MNIYFNALIFISQWISYPRACTHTHPLFPWSSFNEFLSRLKSSSNERTGGGGIDRRCLPTERIYDPIQRSFFFFPSSLIESFRKKIDGDSLQRFRWNGKNIPPLPLQSSFLNHDATNRAALSSEANEALLYLFSSEFKCEILEDGNLSILRGNKKLLENLENMPRQS